MEAHQQLGAGAGGAAHLDAARGIGGGEEGLGPGRVVAVDEGALGAVDRDRLGIGGEAGHADLQLLRLLAGALEQRPRAADRGADRSRRRALDQALRETRIVVSISSKPSATAIAASAASCSGSSLALVTCAWLPGVLRARILE